MNYLKMDPFLSSLGLILKQIRVNKNLSQDHAEPEISRPTLSKWERGLTPPNLSFLKRLCEIYDIKLSEIIKRSEDLENENRARQK